MGEPSARPVPVNESARSAFKQPCTASIEVAGWTDDDHLDIVTKPFISTDEDGTPDDTPSCVQSPARSSLDVTKNNALPPQTEATK